MDALAAEEPRTEFEGAGDSGAAEDGGGPSGGADAEAPDMAAAEAEVQAAAEGGSLMDPEIYQRCAIHVDLHA